MYKTGDGGVSVFLFFAMIIALPTGTQTIQTQGSEQSVFRSRFLEKLFLTGTPAEIEAYDAFKKQSASPSQTSLLIHFAVRNGFLPVSVSNKMMSPTPTDSPLLEKNQFESYTDTVSSTSEKITTESTTTSAANDTSQTPNYFEDSVDCSSDPDGFFPHKNCWMYWNCAYNVGYLEVCEGELYYSVEERRCRPEKTVVCGTRPRRPGDGLETNVQQKTLQTTLRPTLKSVASKCEKILDHTSICLPRWQCEQLIKDAPYSMRASCYSDQKTSDFVCCSRKSFGSRS